MNLPNPAALDEFMQVIGGISATTFKDTLQGIQALFTSVAILVGGWWSYTLFIRKRERYPRALVTHRVAHWPVAGGKVLLRVTVDIANQGAVLLVPGAGEIRVQQLRPLTPELVAALTQGEDPISPGWTEVEWPQLYKRLLTGIAEIEPGENDQCLCDFFLDADIETVAIYTHIENQVKRARLLRWWRGKTLGWNLTTSYDLRAPVVDVVPVAETAERAVVSRSVLPMALRQIVPFPGFGLRPDRRQENGSGKNGGTSR